MAVKRIVANIAAAQPAAARAFYGEGLGLALVMDQGWILTFAAAGLAPPQLSIASAGGAGQPVPDLSIEVDDLAATEARLRGLGFVPEYGPCREPWGVTRFFVRDPFGRLVNILAHEPP